mgnify:CR=1 FL=1
MSDEDQGQQGQSAPSMSAEQSADFAAIMASVGQQDAQQQQVQVNEQTADIQAYEAAVASELVETRGAVRLIHVTLSPISKVIRDRYGPNELDNIAQAWAALAVKRPSFSMAAIMGKWGPEFMMAGAIAAPVLPDVIDWIMKPKPKKAEVIQASEVAKPEPVQAPTDEPGARTVTFGTVTP